MKILFINQTFYPDVVATAQQLSDLCLDAKKEGHSVTVLTGRRGYVAPYPFYSKDEQWNGIRIIRTWPPFMKRFSKKTRVFEALFVNICFAWKLLTIGRYDKIVAMTSPPMIASFAAVYAKLSRSKFIYWVMDINPDEIIEAGWISKKDVRAIFLESALRIALNLSRKIIVLDKYMKARLMGKRVIGEKISVCPPWPHDDELRNVSHSENPFRKKHGLQDKFVVMYSGNHSLCHPLDTILDAALILRDDKKIVFFFIGGGERVTDVTDYKIKHKLTNITQLPYQDRHDLAYSLSAADLHTVVMGEKFVGVVHPSKAYGILRLGKPMAYIGPEESPINDLIVDKSLGIRIPHNRPEELVNAIENIRRRSQKDKDALKEVAIAMIEREYSKQKSCHRVLEIITKS